MKTISAPELIKDCYLLHNSLSKNELAHRASLADEERQNLLIAINRFETSSLSKNWKTLFMVSASIEANTDSFFDISDFTVFGHGCSDFVECMGVPPSKLSQRWMDLAYDRQDIGTWGRYFSLADTCEKAFGVKVSNHELLGLYGTGRDLGGRDYPNVSRTMRRYKHYPYPDGWWNFFVDLWRIIGVNSKFDRANSCIRELSVGPSRFEHETLFRFDVVESADLINIVSKDSIFTNDGITFIDRTEAIHSARQCLANLKSYEVDKSEAIKYLIWNETLKTMSRSDFEFINFFEGVIRLSAKHEHDLDRFSGDFIRLNAINL